MFEIREVTYLAVIVRISIALLLGGILGLERELKSRAAGLRTYMLVSVGACMIMLANQYVYQVFEVGDPVRMGAQVVSGIGFLGAGTIIVTQKNKITGLTTAAGLWEAAAVGLCVGIGFYEAAAVGTFLAIFILTAIHRLEALARKHSVVKVINETCYLTDDEKVEVCKRCVAAGADVVKTSTGFGTGGANLHDVDLMY